MDWDELERLIAEYRLVIRPGIGGGGPVVARFKAISLDGKKIEVWKKTYTQAPTLEEAVQGCVAKIEALDIIELTHPTPND